ncbi:hypothetical protein FC72_GL001241 [Companilactobacillus tucceti DSM 20183]|uniref:S-layer protein C-terminal domain-containing protein n=1 Tax=Companilactobacillus tucceti DSM 20183 TaxID=1423811 RepID=A0A0R1IX37_9LACO|nr:hypothetical protein FC72_GL001241 [Companilactobacillus tucceti DSM 20183]
MSFAGGLILFGATQIMNVSADTMSPEQTVQENDSSVTQQDNNSKSEDVENSGSSTQQTNTQQESNNVTNVNSGQSNVSNKNNLQNQNVSINYKSNLNSSVAQASAQTPNQVSDQTQPVSDEENETNKSASEVYNLGSSSFYVDDNKVLHISGGEFTQDQYDSLYNKLNSNIQNYSGSMFRAAGDYDTVSFDSKLTAHGSLHNFFDSSSVKYFNNLENFDTSDVTDFSNFLARDTDIQSFDLGKLDTSSATSMKNMFSGCTSLKSVNTRNDAGKIIDTSKVTDFYGMFYNDPLLESLDLKDLNTSNGNDFTSMFSGDNAITSLDVSGFNTSKATLFTGMFGGVGSSVDGVADIKGLEDFDTSNVTDMSNMFSGVNFDPVGLQKWDTSKVKSMNGMFSSSKISGKLDLSNFVGDSLTSMNQMFSFADKLTEIDLSNLNTPVLADNDEKNPAIWSAFNGCSELQKVDLNKFDGKKISNYTNVFKDCSKLTTIIWPNLSTDSATSFNGMFDGDASLTENSLEFLKQFKTSNVSDFGSMFKGCSSIAEFPVVIQSWDMSSAQDLSSMFYNDISLSSLDLSNWMINDVKSLNNFLSECSSLSDLKLPILDEPKNSKIDMSSMIAGCDGVHTLDFSNFVIPVDTDRSGMLYGTDHLFKLVLNNKVNLNGSSLSYFDIYKGWKNVGNGTDEHPEANLTLHNGTEMMDTYSNNAGPDETWVIAEREFVDYRIEYVDYETKQDINEKYDYTGSYREGLQINIKTLQQRGINAPGYITSQQFDLNSDSPVYNETLPMFESPEAKNLVYQVRLKKYDPFVIEISDVPKAITLIINDPDSIKNNTVLQSLDNTRELDPDKTIITVSGQQIPETQMYIQLSLISRDPSMTPGKTIKNLVDDLIKYAGGEVTLDGSQVVTMPQNMAIDVVYKPNTGNNTTPNQPNNTNGSSVDRVVIPISQTSATFYDRPAVQLYDFDGNVISGKFLGTNTDWFNDEEMTLDGQKYYRVSTNEWVKDNDVYVYVEHISKVRTYKENKVQLKNAHLDNARVLEPSTDWKTDRYAMFNGQKYYRVSTNEFVPIDKVYEYQDSSNVIHSKRATPIFDERGRDVGRTLLSNKGYKTDKKVKINNETYYRVATNEFVKKSDII